MEYLAIKWLHILSATLMFGTGFGTAFYMFFANRSGNVPAIAVVTRLVARADWWFTTPSIIVQPLSGLWMIHLAGFPLSSRWIVWSVALYLLAGACWLPVVWLQLRMRTLAQRSAAAAKEIKVLIDDSVQKIQLGTNLVEQAGTTMSTLVGDVHQVTQIVGEIAVASREQSEGIDQVNQAVAQMDQVTQQNAALVEEAAAATQSLQDQAGELQQTVSVFKIGDAGVASGGGSSRVAGRLALR
jgi:uncharacterized membrane protein